jgi:AbrB family looped-hinge helix DNA binding protein
MQQSIIQNQEEWLKILTKGLVTLPKNWRNQLNLNEGSIVKAKKVGNKIIIEAKEKPVPYRLYSKKELSQFLKDDQLPKKLLKKLK